MLKLCITGWISFILFCFIKNEIAYRIGCIRSFLDVDEVDATQENS